MGGYMLAQVAARDTRLRAVVLEAAPSDMVELVRWQQGRWGPLSVAPALWALLRSGMPTHDSLPKDVVGAIAPKSVLVIGGADDPVVPPAMARSLFDAAREPKELWIVPGAPHGMYLQAAPVQYPERLVGFFTRTLLQNAPKP